MGKNIKSIFGIQVQQYDKILKENIRAITPSLIDNVLNIKVASMEDIPAKLQHTKEREVDFLKIVTDINSKKFILHFEFQLVRDRKMRFRMLEYYLMLRMKYDLPIVQYIIFIGENKKGFENKIEEENLFYQYNVLDIRDIDYKYFIESKNPEVIIFSILSNFGNEDTEYVVKRIISEIQLRSDSELQIQKCLTQLRILSNLISFKPLVEDIMQSITTFFKVENDFLFKKGQSQGIEQGIEQGKIQVILNILKSFPEWNNQKIADIANAEVNLVFQLRSKL